MTELLIAVVALAAGLALGWFLWGRAVAALSARFNDAIRDLAAESTAAKRVPELELQLRDLGTAHSTTSAELAAMKASANERDRGYAALEAQLVATNETLKVQFEQLAGATLQKSQQQFIEMAEQTFKAHRSKADAGLKELLTPVADTLKRYEERLGQVEAVRTEGYGKLTQLLEQVAKGQDRVSGQTMKLATALRSSGKVAGRWGEEQCRNVLEMAGLVDGVDFTAQTTVESEVGRQRPDFTLTLPGGRKLVIDVKCSLDSYVAAAECESDEERARHLKAHAAAVRAHATGLASKSYEKSVEGAVDFVVLFVPGENFLMAAIEQDRALMNDFMAKRLVLAGPINLIAVARTVAAMRDQERLAKQAAEIAKLGRELYDSLRIMGGNINGVQKALDGAVGSWNKLVTQIDSRVMLRARRLDDYGATTGLETIPEIKAVDQLPALPTSPEFAVLPSIVGDDATPAALS